MIKFRYKLDNETIEELIPEKWEEVKMKHLLRLEKEEPVLNHHALACFTDTPLNQFLNAYSNDDIDAITAIVSFLNNKPNWRSVKKQRRVKLGDKYIKPPQNIKLKTIGQKSVAMPIISKYSEDQKTDIEDVLQLLAIYFQPEYTGKYDEVKIPGIKQLILEAKAIECMPWFIFFLRRLQPTKIFGLIDFKLSIRTLKRLQIINKQGRANLTHLTN